jgi:hypothetical protein
VVAVIVGVVVIVVVVVVVVGLNLGDLMPLMVVPEILVLMFTVCLCHEFCEHTCLSPIHQFINSLHY